MSAKIVMNSNVKKVLNIVLVYCLLLIVSTIFFFPCLWLILSSFSKTGSLYDINGFFPKSILLMLLLNYLLTLHNIIIQNGY